MTMYFVHNAGINSHTGLYADPHVERTLNSLAGSGGCFAGDESARSAKARDASKKADQFSENAEGTGRDTDHITAANLHVEAARAHSNAAQKSGSDVASEQHRQAATEHLEKGIEHQTAVDNMRRRNRDEEDDMDDDDDDDVTTNSRFGHVGFAEDFIGLPPTLNFADDSGTATARAGMGPRGGGSGRGPNRSQAMGDVRPYPGQGDEDEDTETARRAAEQGRQRNRQFNDFGAGESQGLVDEPRGSTASPDGRQLWGGQDRANADFPDSAYDDQSLALDASGAPINVMDTVTESNASPRLMQALRDRDNRDRENQRRTKLRNL